LPLAIENFPELRKQLKCPGDKRPPSLREANLDELSCQHVTVS
jgi:hypothetical protein